MTDWKVGDRCGWLFGTAPMFRADGEVRHIEGAWAFCRADPDDEVAGDEGGYDAVRLSDLIRVTAPRGAT